MANPPLYDFDMLPYSGDLGRYGFGPAHRWFDYYSGEDDGGGDDEEKPLPYPGEGGPDGGAQDARGPSGRSYSEMSPDEFNQVAQNRANAGWFERNVPGIIAGLISPVPGVGWGLGRFDDAMFDSEQDKRAGAFAGLGQSMPDEFMGQQFEGGAPGGYDGGGYGGQTEGGFSGSGVEGDRGFLANGGMLRKGGLPPPRYIRGPGDGRSDSVRAYADGGPVEGGYRLSAGEMVIPADAVSAAGRGSSEAGAKTFSDMVQMLRRQHMNRMGALPPPGR